MAMLAHYPAPVLADRGVFHTVAAPGEVVLVAIDSTGHQVMRWQMPDWLFTPELEDLLRGLLRKADPPMVSR